ncbi:MAG: DUF3108 domain-containing protein [Proteobacteria bacterium]|nr:DUF3108 domain-containing protein [Pseudomonadota bacterium]
MTNLRAFFGLAIVCLAGVPAAAQPQLAWAPSDRIELVYEVYAGARVAVMSLEFGISGDRYTISTRQASAGVVRWLWPWHSNADVRGRFLDNATVPETYRVHGESRGKARSVAMDYRDGELVRVDAVPSNNADERDEVLPDQRRGAIDPASAIMTVIRQVNEGKACDARTPVFDGRQRYDIVFKDRGLERLERTYFSAFEGDARVCEFHWVPIAGRLRRAGMPQRTEDDKRAGRALMARFGDGPAQAPVRIEFEAWFGTIVGYLREVRTLEQTATAED